VLRFLNWPSRYPVQVNSNRRYRDPNLRFRGYPSTGNATRISKHPGDFGKQRVLRISETGRT
jgi:hypothetical protein